MRKSDGGNKFEIEPLIKKSKVAAPSNDEKSKLIEKETVEVGRVSTFYFNIKLFYSTFYYFLSFFHYLAI